jgi:Tfp pilus assembly protein PilX
MKNPSRNSKNTPQAHAKPQGATSLLLVIGMALVFIVMITGLTSLSIRQSRQASNTDLSNRALATAEASARDAALWIQANPGKQYPECSSTDVSTGITNVDSLKAYIPTADTNNTTEIVCRTVTVSSTKPSGQIKKDESVQLFTYEPSGTGIDTMSFQWGKNSALPSAFDPWPTLNKYTTDYSNAPAVVELSLYYWQKGTSTTTISPVDVTGATNPIKVKTVLLYASAVTGEGVSIANSNIGRLSSPTCSATLNAAGYNCKVGIDLSAILGAGGSPVDAKTYNIVAKLKPRYKDTDYQASFCPSAPNQNSTNACSSGAKEVRSSRALIDVTAKVGSLYRRIQAETAVEGSSFFDDVLYSNAPIEKNLTVCSIFKDIKTATDFTGCELE